MTDLSPAALLAHVFLAAVVLSLSLRLWLAWRQMRHVATHRHAVPSAFAGRIALEDHQKAADYTRARLTNGIVELLVETALLLTLTLGGGLQVLYDFAARFLAAGTLLHGLAFFAALGLVSFVIDLPFSLWRTFITEARFGFNKMTFATFVSDLFKGGLVAVVIGLPVGATVLWLMRASGPQWWVWVWLFWIAFQLLAMVLFPVLVAPLFNKFTPLPDGALKSRIEALLARCAFRSSGLFVMDGSKRSGHGNAYFTGLGRAKRIVFFDTLINILEPDEAEAVLAHELGHFKLRHLWQRVAVMSVTSLAMLAVLGVLSDHLWFYAGLGMQARGEAPALALFMYALPVFLFPLTPLSSLWSRVHEFQADRYATRHADAQALVSALVKLFRENASTLTPDPLYSLFYDSHPPAPIRIARLQAQ